jgi:hypothetical protein
MRRLDAIRPATHQEVEAMKTAERLVTCNAIRVRISNAALAVLSPDDVLPALLRHLEGDWGELDEQEWKENDVALECGFRLRSAYTSEAGVKFVIITEPDGSMTTIELPSETSQGNPVSH